MAVTLQASGQRRRRGGGLLRGVRYHNWWAETHSLVMRAQSGTVREIMAKHHIALPPDQATKVH